MVSVILYRVDVTFSEPHEVERVVNERRHNVLWTPFFCFLTIVVVIFAIVILLYSRLYFYY